MEKSSYSSAYRARDGAFGGSNTSFVRTNCREISIHKINAVAAVLTLNDSDRNALLASLSEKSNTKMTLICMGSGALLLGVWGVMTILDVGRGRPRPK